METITYLVLIITGFALALAALSIWSPRKPWVKFLGVALAAGVIIIGYVGMTDLLSRPKPVHLEWALDSVKEATVLGGKIEEGEGIYILLDMPEFSEPRYYKLPWSRNLAEQFQEAMRESKRSGIPMKLRNPFEPSWDDKERKFYAPPQPALPLKDEGGSGSGPRSFEDLEKENKSKKL